ncbi:MAG: hypothetical protein XD78_1092 [Desulfotomaculum sp. 46_296]|nr:MAG: hypothetical protein XD78_1092 [Desulfotomaculum sp. 46_296]
MKNRMQINKVLAVAVVLCVLAAAWFYGGNNHNSDNATPSQKPASTMKSGEAEFPSIKAHGQTTEKAMVSQAHSDDSARTKSGSAANQILTDPLTPGKPQPVEPQNAQVTGKKRTCTLSVECTTILHNMKDFNQDKLEMLPSDGIIFPAQKVTFFEGESVFNVSQREMKKAGIQFEFEATPLYNSNYIESINNIYEFDCGELSGWMYKVNGCFPNYGCSRYELKDGDNIEWVYTCNSGRDLGGNYVTNRGGV